MHGPHRHLGLVLYKSDQRGKTIKSKDKIMPLRFAAGLIIFICVMLPAETTSG